MLKKIIKIFSFTLMTLTVAGCSDDIVSDVPGNSETETKLAISFEGGVFGSQAATRADGSLVNRLVTSLPETKPRTYWVLNADGSLTAHQTSYYAGIFAAYTGDKRWNELSEDDIHANFMFNQKMSIGASDDMTKNNPLSYFRDDNTTYSDSLIRFWPNQTFDDGGTQRHEFVSFWAYYPYNTTREHGIAITTDDETGMGKGMGAVKFTMNSDAAEQSDFLISELVADRSKDTNPLLSEGNPKPVQFRFHHMLAQVRIFAFIRGTDRITYASYTDGDEEKTLYVTDIDDATDVITFSNGSTKTVADNLRKYVNQYGMTKTLEVGNAVPDDTPWMGISEPKSIRWARNDVVDVSGIRRRITATYSLEFNNVYTSCIFKPVISYDGGTGTYKTTSEVRNVGVLGSTTVNHYIMNPYWFRYYNKQRTMLNETYMYDYFEDTPGYLADSMTDEEAEEHGKEGNDGINWKTYGGSNALAYLLNDETLDQDSPEGKHYNYAPGNILLMVPQVLDDDNVPNIVLNASGKRVEYVQDAATGEYSEDVKETMPARLTVNFLKMNIKWESGFIYSYALLDDLMPYDDKVRGPEAITTVFDPTKHTWQW